jgi:Pentapeptide repeats (8 copies)
MPDKTSLKILQLGVSEWNQWRKNNPTSKSLDLSEADLVGQNLAHVNFENVSLVGAKLTGANLAKSNLSHANLSCADLTNACLHGANLHMANLTGADITEIRVVGAVLYGLKPSEIETKLESIQENSEWDDDVDDKIEVNKTLIPGTPNPVVSPRNSLIRDAEKYNLQHPTKQFCLKCKKSYPKNQRVCPYCKQASFQDFM